MAISLKRPNVKNCSLLVIRPDKEIDHPLLSREESCRRHVWHSITETCRPDSPPWDSWRSSAWSCATRGTFCVGHWNKFYMQMQVDAKPGALESSLHAECLARVCPLRGVCFAPREGGGTKRSAARTHSLQRAGGWGWALRSPTCRLAQKSIGQSRAPHLACFHHHHHHHPSVAVAEESHTATITTKNESERGYALPSNKGPSIGPVGSTSEKN